MTKNRGSKKTGSGLPKRERKHILVTGSRDWSDYKFLKEKLDFLTSALNEPPVIVTGGSFTKIKAFEYIGAEYLAEKWAHSKKHLVLRFHPEPDVNSRNKEMLEAADRIVIFEKTVDQELQNLLKMADSLKIDSGICIRRYRTT